MVVLSAPCMSPHPDAPATPHLHSLPPAMQSDQFYVGYTSVSKPVMRGGGRNVLTSQMSNLALLPRSAPSLAPPLWFP